MQNVTLHAVLAYDILEPEVFCDAQNVANSFLAVVPPSTPLWELMMFPQNY